MKFSIAPSGTEDWTELTCTGECFAIDPHRCTYRQYQIPYNAKDETLTASWRLKRSGHGGCVESLNRAEYRCDVFDDIRIQDATPPYSHPTTPLLRREWMGHRQHWTKTSAYTAMTDLVCPQIYLSRIPKSRPPVTSSSCTSHHWTGRGHPYKPEESSD